MRQPACPGTTDLLALLSFASFADKCFYSVAYDVFGESNLARDVFSRASALLEESMTYGAFGEAD